MVDRSSGNTEKPYKELSLGRYKLRYFSNKNPKELFWHRDENNRKIRLIYGNVQLQFDNRMPFDVIKWYKYKIKKMEYHRVISDKPFLMLIKEE